MATRKPAGRTRSRRSTQRRAKRGKAVKTETTVGSRPGGGSTWEGLDGSASAIWPRSGSAPAAPVEPTPPASTLADEAQPERTPVATEGAQAAAATCFDPEAWVSVRYVGASMVRHPEAGLFVHGTTTMLRGRLAQTFVGVEGFRVGA